MTYRYIACGKLRKMGCFRIIFVILILASASLIILTTFSFTCKKWKEKDEKGNRNIAAGRIHQMGKNYTVKRLRFDPNGNKIIVVLHIQKTGGSSFGLKLMSSLNVTPKCRCRPGNIKPSCKCLNNHGNIWIYSGRFSTGWKCGVHAEWTELTECIDAYFKKHDKLHRNRRYLYITMLRDPIQRYISEWKHVQRGATWEKQIKCNHRKVTTKELPACFQDNWKDVHLDDFMNCPYNLAINRQTRMLANLSLVDCYNTSAMPIPKREKIMLESAKNNLRNMAFFGLTEFQEQNQNLFEYTFGVNFTKDFSQHQTNAENAENELSVSQLEKIKKLNHLDVQLYQYAKELYLIRMETMKQNKITARNSI